MKKVFDPELPEIIIEVGKDIDHAQCPSCNTRYSVLYEEEKESFLHRLATGLAYGFFAIGLITFAVLVTLAMNPELIKQPFSNFHRCNQNILGSG